MDEITALRFEDEVCEINKRPDLFAFTVCPAPVVSTNDMYIPVAKKQGTRRGYYMRSNSLITYQETLTKYLNGECFEKISEFLKYCYRNYSHLGFKISHFIGMPNLFYKQKSKIDDLRPYDVSNYLKSTEDIIAKVFGIDDKYNMKVEAQKYRSQFDEDWRLTVVMRPLDYILESDEIFAIKRLLQVSLGGCDCL